LTGELAGVVPVPDMVAGKIDDLLAEQICQYDGGPVREELM
jgi:hypothetical protein